MRTGPLGLLAAVGIAAAASIVMAWPGETTPPEPGAGTKGTQLDCIMTSADTCGAICPCLFGEAPHHGGHCRFVGVFEVKKGTIDGETLDRARFAVAGEFSGATRTKPGLDTTKFWVDPSTVKEPARGKLVAFLGANMAGKRSFGVSLAKINLAGDPGDLGVRRFEIEGKALFTIRPLAGADGERPIRIENAWSPFHELEPVVVGTADGKLKDEEIGIAVSNGSGEIHQVRITGPSPSPGS